MVRLHGAIAAPDRSRAAPRPTHDIDENPFRRVAVDPLSTFSIDVDTASYANVRRFLNDGIAAAGGRGAHRGADQLLPLRLPAADRRRAVLGDDRAGRVPVESEAPARAASACRAAQMPESDARRATSCS